MTPAAGRDRLVALGDSITVGVGDTVGPDAVHGPGWAAHLATVLGVAEFTNLASNGARSRDVADTQLGVALALRPRLATVLVGGNDVLRSDFDARLTLADLRRCVEELCRAGTDVVLVRLPVIGLFELAPRLVRHVMRRRVAAINAAVDEVAATVGAGGPGAGVGHDGGPGSTGDCRPVPTGGGRPAHAHAGGRVSDRGGTGPARGQVVVVDAAQAIAPAGARAWHVDRVHPSPAGHRRLALSVAAPPAVLAARLPAAPDPPGVWQRVGWLVRAGLPWCVRRGRDFLPGLLRAVVHDLRAERVLTPGGMVTSLADSGLDPRRRIGRG